MGSYVQLAQRDPHRAHWGRKLREIFEAHEVGEHFNRPAGQYGHLVSAARALFWACNVNGTVKVSARVSHLVDAARDLECAMHVAASDGFRGIRPEHLDIYSLVQNTLALAQSYLREDLDSMVKPALRREL